MKGEQAHAKRHKRKKEQTDKIMQEKTPEKAETKKTEIDREKERENM